MSALTPLGAAVDPEGFGGKAAQLAAALSAGLPVPGGYALDPETVRAAVDGDPRVCDALGADVLGERPWAVRSSAIGEDSAAASFAGTHVSVLGMVGRSAVLEAVRTVHESGNAPGAYAYREQHGLDTAPRMAVVLQEMVASEVAGVLFTRNPVTGAAERLVEASWGLGEMVVSGQVTPDQYRLDPSGRPLERIPGEKDLALWLRKDGSVAEEPVEGSLVESLCLDDARLDALHRLAVACDRVFATEEHDIEFAFAANQLYLLQRRPITHG